MPQSITTGRGTLLCVAVLLCTFKPKNVKNMNNNNSKSLSGGCWKIAGQSVNVGWLPIEA